MINFAVLWMIEVPLAYILAVPFGFGATGVFVAIAICHSLDSLVSWWWFRQGKLKLVQV